MYFSLNIGKLPGVTNEFQRSMVFETGEFERTKFNYTFFYIEWFNENLSKGSGDMKWTVK